MKAHDPELERRLDELRGVAEPAAADKRRVLESVRAAIELKSSPPPPAISSEPLAGEPAPTAHREPREVPSQANIRRLWPWLGGAWIGAALGLALGLGWGHRESAPASPQPRAPVPYSSLPAAGASMPGGSVPAEARAITTLEAPTASRDPSPSVIADREQRRDPATRDPEKRSPAKRNPEKRSPAKRRQAIANAAPPALKLLAPAPEHPLALDSALELLHRAEKALHAAEPQLALGLLGDLDRRASRALLRQERLTTLTLALCQLGRHEEARAARQDLQHEFEGSIYASRLERSCAAIPSGEGSR